MTVITVYGYENMKTECISMLLKSRVHEDSRPVRLLLGRIGEVEHDPRHKVTFSPDSKSIAELSGPRHQVAERR